MDVYITRQPIFVRDGSVLAYEMLYRSRGEKNSAESASENGAEEPSFFGVDVMSITGDEKVVINFTDELIKQGVPRTFSPDVLDVMVSADRADNEWICETVKALKESGYKIVLDGFDHSDAYAKLFALADVIGIDIKAPKELLKEAEDMCYRSNKQLFARNVNTNSDFEYAVRMGCKYLQGYFYARSSAVAGGSVKPIPANLIEVMHLMAQPEPEIKDIVDVMSRDTALCQKILKLINSVYFGVSHRVSSINQAILILGLDYLREWVYLMGMQKISQNDSVEVMRLALLIAKFCRGLSGLIPETADKGDAVYLMGLLSMIVLSSDRDLAQALDEFPLTNDIKKGLLRCGGTYSDIFEMALLYVDGKWEGFESFAEKYSIDIDKVSDMFIQYAHEIGSMNMS